MHTFTQRRRKFALVGVTAASAALLISCSNNDDMSGNSMSGTSSTASHPGKSMPSHSGMSDMAGGGGNGLQATVSGLTLQPTTSTLPAESGPWTFQITSADGKPVTKFTPVQTKLMHFFVVRNDLSVFNHLHPTMAADGTWTADIPALVPGTYRVYTEFTAQGDEGKLVTPVLSTAATVPGAQTPVPLPEPAPTTSVDGYDLAVDASALEPGEDGELTVTVTKDGQPVTDLQPYLDSYAHVTAIRAQDMAFAHLHPEGAVDGDRGGPTLKLRATLPETGDGNGLWRVFLQFQTGGTLHTAAITLRV